MNECLDVTRFWVLMMSDKRLLCYDTEINWETAFVRLQRQNIVFIQMLERVYTLVLYYIKKHLCFWSCLVVIFKHSLFTDTAWPSLCNCSWNVCSKMVCVCVFKAQEQFSPSCCQLFSSIQRHTLLFRELSLTKLSQCARVQSLTGLCGTERGCPQTAPTKFRAWNCPECLGRLKH